MAYGLGKFTVNNNLQSLLSEQVTLPTPVGSYVEIGILHTDTGAHDIFVSAVLSASGGGVSKQFGVSMHVNQTNGEWFRVSPLNSTPAQPVNDFSFEVMSTGQDIYFRVRRILGSDAALVSINIQNTGQLNETFTNTSASGVASDPPSSIASIPHTMGTVDHNTLFNRGVNTHVQIDAHIDAQTPHGGHERTSNKDVAGGYAGLNAQKKLDIAEIPTGSTADTVCIGNDPRLSALANLAVHGTNHSWDGSDPLDVNNLAGELPQSRTHRSADTDSATSAIHHTIGTLGNQAAAGDHNHNAVYAPIAKGVTGGDSHDHTNGAGALVLHSSLGEIGLRTHTQIDAHLSASAPHSGHESIANKGVPSGYAGLDAVTGKVPPEQLPIGTTAGTVAAGNDPRFSSPQAPAQHASTHYDGNSDALQLSQLSGNLQENRTHDLVDTSSAGAIHHTIGTTAITVAAGNHNHNSVYASISNGVTNGDSHTHSVGDGGTIDHGSLSSAGSNSHAQIDLHISASSPHSGHESTINKGAANGYAGLDGTGKVPGAQIYYGSTSETACQGDDARLSDSRNPRSHSTSHSSGGSDEVSLSDLAGTLDAAKTHDNVDLTSVNAIHRQLGYASANAAAGDHTHTLANSNQVAHEDLTGIGTNSHDLIDAHISAASPHTGHEVTANKNATNGYAGLSGGKLASTVYTFGSAAGTVCAGDDPRLSDTRAPGAHAASHSSGQSDEISLSNLAGTLDESRTHGSMDTTAGTGYHHLLGYSADRAAPGDHNHDLAYLKLSGGSLSGMLTLSGDPTADMHPVTKHYLDLFAQGYVTKGSVRTASNGLNYATSGPANVGGVAVADGNRVLLKNQDIASENGIYVVNTAGAWARSTDFDGNQAGEVTSGAHTYVEEGQLASTTWTLTTPGTIDIGVTELTFTQTSGPGTVGAGSGLTLGTGNTVNVVSADSGRIVVNADSIDLALTGVTPATYPKVTVDAYGRVTNGSALSTADLPAAIPTSKIANGLVQNTEFQFLSGVTSSIQTQINGKAPTAHQHSGADITSTVADADTVDGMHAVDLVPATDVVAIATANKLLKLDGNGKLPASITGDAVTFSGYVPGDFSFASHNHDTVYAAIGHTHSGVYATVSHQHSGADITSAVANAVDADTLDGSHASAFATAAHTHTKSAITDFAHTHLGSDITSAVASASNATTVAGYSVGHSNGNVPLSDGTLCVGLDADTLDGNHSTAFATASHQHAGTDITSVVANATDSDKLDGYQSGNSANQIPISNTTVCTNLNADMLDGNHAGAFATASHNHDLTYSQLSHTHSSYALARTAAPGAGQSSIDQAYMLYDTGAGTFKTSDQLTVGAATTAGTANTATTATSATTATTATNATNVAIINDTTTVSNCYPMFVVADSGNQASRVCSSKLYFIPNTGVLASPNGFSGPLTGNVTGNCSGSSGSCTGNASTATTATTAIKISLTDQSGQGDGAIWIN